MENFKAKKPKTPEQVKEAARVKSAFGQAVRAKPKRGPKRSV